MYESSSGPGQTPTVEKHLPKENFGSRNLSREIEDTYDWNLPSGLAWPIHVPCTGRQIDFPLYLLSLDPCAPREVHFWKDLSEYLKLRENICAGEEEILDYHFDLLQRQGYEVMAKRPGGFAIEEPLPEPQAYRADFHLDLNCLNAGVEPRVHLQEVEESQIDQRLRRAALETSLLQQICEHKQVAKSDSRHNEGFHSTQKKQKARRGSVSGEFRRLPRFQPLLGSLYQPPFSLPSGSGSQPKRRNTRIRTTGKSTCMQHPGKVTMEQSEVDSTRFGRLQIQVANDG